MLVAFSNVVPYIAGIPLLSIALMLVPQGRTGTTQNITRALMMHSHIDAFIGQFKTNTHLAVGVSFANPNPYRCLSFASAESGL